MLLILGPKTCVSTVDLFLATEEVINKITAARLIVRRVSHAIGLATAGYEMSGGFFGSFRCPADPVWGYMLGLPRE